MEAIAPTKPSGGVGAEDYRRVRQLIMQGLKTTDAVAQVASETGKSAGAVQANYYRIARSDPASGVKHRTRKAKAAAKPATRRRSDEDPLRTLEEAQGVLMRLHRQLSEQDRQGRSLSRLEEKFQQMERLLRG